MAADDTDHKPVGWRDVYELVTNTRQEIMGRLDSLDETVSTTLGTHEHRLTVVEEHTGHQATAIASLTERVDGHGKAIGELKDQQRSDEVATRVIQNRRDRWRDWRRWALATAAVLGSAILGAVVTALVH